MRTVRTPRWQRARLVGFVGAGLVGLVASVSMLPADRPADPPARDTRRAQFTIPRQGALPWGVYEILLSHQHYGGQLDATSAQLGGKPQFVLFYRDLSRPYPSDVCAEVIAHDAIPVISLELLHWHGPRKGRLQAIIRGEYDAFFRRYAEDARASTQLALFRFGFEMNGDVVPWGGDPEAFQAAWRRVRDIFHSAGCRNLLWVWAPAATSGPNEPWNGIEKYWPGNSYVDVIGLDGYNFGDAYNATHRWQSAAEIFGPPLDAIRSSGVPHPVLITEFACAHDGQPQRRAAWIRDAHAFLSARPEIIGAIWFNYDKSRERAPNWRIDADALSLQAWQETFLAGVYGRAQLAPD